MNGIEKINACGVMIYQVCGLDKKIPVLVNGNFLAEAVGFEPTSLLRGYLISSQGRYDHFDTLPYSVLEEARDRSGHNVHAVGGT